MSEQRDLALQIRLADFAQLAQSAADLAIARTPATRDARIALASALLTACGEMTALAQECERMVRDLDV